MNQSRNPRVYVACKFERKDLCWSASAVLVGRGVEPIQTWHLSKRATDGEATDAQKRDAALQALEEIAQADAVVVADPNSKTGGLHWESAWACAHGKPVFIVGEPTNIFHHLPWVRRAATAEDAAAQVQMWWRRRGSVDD